MFLILALIVLVAALKHFGADHAGEGQGTTSQSCAQWDKGRDPARLLHHGPDWNGWNADRTAIGTVVCINIVLHRFVNWVTSTDVFNPELYFLSTLPAKIDRSETAAIVVMALALSYLATLYPAWRAARLDPVEALRYE